MVGSPLDILHNDPASRGKRLPTNPNTIGLKDVPFFKGNESLSAECFFQFLVAIDNVGFFDF